MTKVGRVALVAGIACALAACSGSTASNGDGGGGGTSGNAGTTGGAGTMGGRGGSGGAGGLATCPATPPTTASPCPPGIQCFYEDCLGAGRTMAVCRAGAYLVFTKACAPISCSGTHGPTCPAGQVCLERIGGALIRECVDGCGTGPLTCACLSVQCPGACTVTVGPEGDPVAQCTNCVDATCG